MIARRRLIPRDEVAPAMRHEPAVNDRARYHQTMTDKKIDAMADDGRLGALAKHLAIDAGEDWPSLDGEAQDAWHEAAIAKLAEPQPAKRKSSTSPTQRTLAECRKRGIVAQVVERWNPHARVRVDLFGVIDLVAIVPRVVTIHGQAIAGQIVGIQACAGASHAERRTKILAEPRARQWVEAGGRLELWSWSKRGDRGKAKRWTLRVETYEEMRASEAAT